MQHVYPTWRGEAVKHPALHRDTPTTAWVFTNTLIKPNRESHCPHCTHVTRPPARRFQGESARGHTVPVTQEKRRSKYVVQEKIYI